jgi:cbb3-type cytochrome oxidase maturation protein
MKISLPVDTRYALPGTRKIFLQERKIKSMSVIIILLIASISVAALFLVAFLWGVKSGQFEDDYSPSSRILFDDKPASSTKKV